MTITTDKTLVFLDAVADWAAARHVEIRIWRTDAQAPGNWATPIRDWRVTVTLKDSEGLFQGTLTASHPADGETDQAFARSVGAALDRCCAEARRRRIVAYAGIDPRRLVADARR
jgi:hypothetical protein